LVWATHTQCVAHPMERCVPLPVIPLFMRSWSLIFHHQRLQVAFKFLTESAPRMFPASKSLLIMGVVIGLPNRRPSWPPPPLGVGGYPRKLTPTPLFLTPRRMSTPKVFHNPRNNMNGVSLPNWVRK